MPTSDASLLSPSACAQGQLKSRHTKIMNGRLTKGEVSPNNNLDWASGNRPLARGVSGCLLDTLLQILDTLISIFFVYFYKAMG